MRRREFLNRGVALAASALPPRSNRERPNFVFILCDDLGWGDLPCYGHRFDRAHGGWLVRGDLQMPHTDRLAREGARFTQFYVASAVCSPSRAALMTGQFPGRLGMHDYLAGPALNQQRGMPDSLDPAVPNVTHLLRKAGYATAHFGKWHLSSGQNAPTPNQYGIGRYAACSQDRPHSSGRIADETIAFLEAHKTEPFFVNVWMYDPHNPLHPTEEMMAPYKELSSGWAGQRSAFEIYYGVLTYLDRQVGRILEALDRLSLAGNTLVIFSSDNGPESGLIPFISQYGAATTAGPFRGLKRSLYEGGVRAPFIARWPGRIPAGAVDDRSVIGGVDFLPTVCSLAGVALPPGLTTDGEDASPAVLGRPWRRTKALMWENRFPVYGHVLDMSPILAIRDGNWKLLMNPDRSRMELYNVPADPSEMTNLASRERTVVKELAERVLRWQATLPKGPIDPRAGKNDYPWPR